MNVFLQTQQYLRWKAKVACAPLMAALLLSATAYAAPEKPVNKSSATQGTARQNVTGTVKDAKGEPLPGVSVRIKGSNTGTSTDAQGVYRINAPEGNTILVFTFVGFKTREINIGSQTTVDVVMQEDITSLEDVVVNVGYATKRRSEILGAVATVKASELEDIPAPNIAATLRNRIAGVGVSSTSGRPGASISLNIRNSRSTSYGQTEPLYVIDGIIATKEQFDALDPALVEDLSILKDATAAIYGAAGAKGVVLITTKRGKAGKTTLSYNGYVGVSDAAREPNTLSAYEHALLLNQTYDVKQNVASTEYFSDADLELLKNNRIPSWYDKFWQAALTQRHNLSISGGSDKITFFAGGNFQNENANYAGMSQNRYGFRSGLTATILTGLKADVNFSVNNNAQNSKNGLSETDQNFYQTLVKTPKWTPLEINGNPITLGAGNVRNPLALLNSGYYEKQNNTNYQVNAALNYSPSFLNGLTARMQFAQTGSNGKGRVYAPPYKLYNYARTGNNNLLYADIPDPVTPVVDGLSMANSRYTRSYSRGSSYQAIFTLNYAKTIGKHNMSMLLGGDRAKGSDESSRFYYSSQQVANIDEYWAFDQNTFTQQGISDGESIKQSWLSRVSYDFNKRYFFDAIARYDASTKFAADQVWGLSYNVGLGWNISEENFFKDNVSFINSLRLKANFGVSGDDRVGGNSRLWQENYKVDLVNTGYLYGDNMVGSLNPTQYPNPDITWEKARIWNVGIESSMFNNRLDFNLQAFHRVTYDAFDAYNTNSIPQYAGLVPPAINYAEFIADGMEFTIGYRGNLARDLKFNTSVNFGISSGYQSKGMVNPFQLFENSPEDWQYFVGTDARKFNSSNFGLIAKGMLKTQEDVDALLAQNPNYTIFTQIPQRGWLYYEDSNGDGKINERDYVPMYNHPNPFSTGLSLGLSYKALALNTNIAGNFGGKVFYDSQAMKAPSKTENVDSFWKDHWTPENPDGLFPRQDDPSLGKKSTFWAVDGTMVRINNMTLSYSLPMKYLNKAGFSSVRILATGNNLWTIVNPLKYKDPYTSSILDYPTLRTISVGLNVGL